jgi:hypothetical protein
VVKHLVGEAQHLQLELVERGGIGARLERRDLRLGEADLAGELLVLVHLVPGAAEHAHAQDRDLAQPRIELVVAQQRPAEP